MDGFTTLELQAFADMAEGYPDIASALRGFIGTARVTERSNTGHGFYTSFEADRSGPTIVATPAGYAADADFEVTVGGEVLLMGFLLWLRGGYPQCLEGFQYGTRTGTNIDLKQHDLAALVRSTG